MLATPSTSVAARPAMVATTSVAKETVPLGFSFSLTSEGYFSLMLHTSLYGIYYSRKQANAQILSVILPE